MNANLILSEEEKNKRHNVEVLGQLIGTCTSIEASDILNRPSCDYYNFESLIDGLQTCYCLSVDFMDGSVVGHTDDTYDRSFTLSLFDVLVKASERK